MSFLSIASSQTAPLMSEKDFSTPEVCQSFESLNSLDKFKDIEDFVQEQSISQEDESVLIYIAGYIAHNVMKN